MSTWKKIAIGAGVVVLLSAIVGFTVYQSHKNVVTVQTGKAQRMDLVAIVSASGEIKPKTYVNIGANAFGKITKLYVREGDRVKRGQMLAQLENVQPAADMDATQASLEAARTDAVAAEAALNTSAADLNRAKSDAERSDLDWSRAQGLYKDALISKSDYDMQKSRSPNRGCRAGTSRSPRSPGEGAKRISRPPHWPSRRESNPRSRCFEKDNLSSSVRWRDYEFAGARRRDGSDRNPEFTGQHADDAGGYVCHHRRSKSG